MKFRAVYIVSLVLLMLVTGVFWGTWFTLTRSLGSFSTEEFIHIGKVIIANVAMPMRMIMPLCILFMLLSLLLYPRKKSSRFYCNVIAFALIVITLLITLLVLVPIDNQIKLWTVSTVPVNVAALRNRWELFHEIRTFTCLGSFVCFALSMIDIRRRRE